MNRKLVIGGLVFLGGVVVVIGLAYGLVHALNDNNDEEEGGKTDQWKGRMPIRQSFIPSSFILFNFQGLQSVAPS